MSEALFYHLKNQTLEQTLPLLISKCLAQGWRMVVQFGTMERRDDINTHLWTYKDDSFIPHGVEEDGYCEQQPVYLTCKNENPNNAKVKFFVDRADSSDTDFSLFERTMFVFSDQDQEGKREARETWRRLTAESGIGLIYWQQDYSGKWERKK